MNEIEKMYENAKVKPVCDGLDCWACVAKCNNSKYPEFTAEKQLSLMSFLINRKVGLSFKAEQGEITIEVISRGLAGIVNRIWQDLTEEQKQQIKEILE